MRVLLVHPGATWSVQDCYVGLRRGLEECGVEVFPYRLDERLGAAQEWIKFSQKKINGKEITDDDIDLGDLYYQASKGAVIRALEIAADVVINVSGLLFEARALVCLQRAKIPVLIYGTESPYDDDLYERLGSICQWLTVNERASVDPLQSAISASGSQCQVSYLPLGFDPTIHYPGVNHGTTQNAHDVVFVGTFFPGRIAFMESIDWSNIDIGFYGAAHWLDDYSPLWKKFYGGIVDNRVTMDLYNNSKIVLNLFRDDSSLREGEFVKVRGAEGVNPRMIECAAIGKFMISEYRPCVEEIFGDRVPTFRTPDELENLIKYWLQKDSERDIIESELPGCVTDFSYTTRAREIVKIIS